MRTKPLTVTLAILMLLSIVSFMPMELPTAAADPAPSGDFEYAIERNWWTGEESVRITGYTGPGGDVVIPDTIEGARVTSIDYSAFYGAPIASVVIPDSVTFIGDGAFGSCTSLTSVTVGNGVTELYDTFVCCFNLESVTLGENVTVIGDSTFAYCFALTSIDIPASVARIERRSFSYCFALSSMVFEGNAPVMQAKWDDMRTAIPQAAPLTMYYYHGATGFSLPMWNGYPSVCLPIRPTAPQNLVVVSGNHSATLSWKAPADDGGAIVDHYVVYMNGNESTTVTNATANITGLNNDELYTFTVAAHNSVGVGKNSTEELAFPRNDSVVMVPPPIDDVDDEGPAGKVSGAISAEQAETNRGVMLGGLGLISVAAVTAGLVVARQAGNGAHGKDEGLRSKKNRE